MKIIFDDSVWGVFVDDPSDFLGTIGNAISIFRSRKKARMMAEFANKLLHEQDDRTYVVKQIVVQ